MSDFVGEHLLSDAPAGQLSEQWTWPAFELADPDVTAPTTTLITPVSLEGIARTQAITIELDDDRGIEYYVIMAVYPTLRRADVIIDGADLSLDVRYTVTPTTVDDKQRWTVVHEGGWPAPGFIRSRPVDGGGNVG